MKKIIFPFVVILLVFDSFSQMNKVYTKSELDHVTVFNQGAKPLKALEQVCSERPLAAVQIGLAIFAVEAFGQFQQKQTDVPGDLNFDPLGLKPQDEETWEKVQLRELKNGRLAMLAIAGMLYTEFVTGNGVIEAWRIGAVSPFNDGKGIF